MSLTPYVHLDVALDGVAAGTDLALPDDDVHHLTRVLRLRVGAAVVVADGRGGEAPARLADRHVVLDAAASVQPPRRPVIVVAQALAKGRKVDEVVRQVTELGADRLVPVAAERSVVDLRGERAGRASERWRAVARASAEQSRSPWRASVDEVTPARDLPGSADRAGAFLVAHPGGRPLPQVLAGLEPDPASVVLGVGPEGGWSDREVERWVAAGAVPVGLGPTVLRTEHAAAAAVAVTAAWSDRWA